MRLRIGENVGVSRAFFPDSCRIRISNFMSSQCTIIVFILQSLVTLMDITSQCTIIVFILQSLVTLMDITTNIQII